MKSGDDEQTDDGADKITSGSYATRAIKSEHWRTTQGSKRMKAVNVVVAISVVCGINTCALAQNKPSVGVSVSVGPVSVSKDGTKCVTILVGPVSPIFCENNKTGESSFGVCTPIGSVMTGGRGNDGKNNFVEVGVGPSIGKVGVEGSVRIPTPSFTRSGITGGTTYDPKANKKK